MDIMDKEKSRGHGHYNSWNCGPAFYDVRPHSMGETRF